MSAHPKTTRRGMSCGPRGGGDYISLECFFFFQAEDGIRDVAVTGVQTCALPILRKWRRDRGGSSGPRGEYRGKTCGERARGPRDAIREIWQGREEGREWSFR